MNIHVLLSLWLAVASPQARSAAPLPGAPEPYTQELAGSDVSFPMLGLPGGRYWMGSPANEAERKAHEGPRHEVEVSAFWIGVHEVTWDEFDLYNRHSPSSDSQIMPLPPGLDALSRPTPPYVPMDFGMGTGQHPAVCMTQFAAKQYTRWLSLVSGHFYRLPTEAEWEYACRAGTTSAYSWGDDPALADQYAWSFENAAEGYRLVMTRQPNSWGLYDMHGNVSEWVLDVFVPEGYAESTPAVAHDPLFWPKALYPRVVRGGSWDDDLDGLRCAARRASSKSWKIQDPQLPKSIWYLTDAPFVGLRVVRPLHEPPPAEQRKYWEPDLDSIRQTLERQRRGER